MNPSFWKKLARLTCLAMAGAVILGLQAQAQQPRGPEGPRINPEDLRAAWELQAAAVANELELSEEAAEQLKTAYLANRRDNQQALRGLAGGARGDVAGRWQEMQRINDESRAALRESLGDVLTANQLNTAVERLGSYNRQADYMAHLIAGYDLNEAQQQQALALIATHVSETDAARQQALAQRDMEALRNATREAKERLDTAMAGLLSEEHAADWREQTAQRGVGPGAAGAGPRPGAGPRGGEPGARPRGERLGPEGARPGGPRGERPRGQRGPARDAT